MPFMSQLLQTLKPGGELILATNDKDYFDESLAFATRAWDLSIAKTSSFSSQSGSPHKPRTHFEKKYLLKGDTCFEARLLIPTPRADRHESNPA
jgi:tRNA G46 methylase TrmB